MLVRHVGLVALRRTVVVRRLSLEGVRHIYQRYYYVSRLLEITSPYTDEHLPISGLEMMETVCSEKVRGQQLSQGNRATSQRPLRRERDVRVAAKPRFRTSTRVYTTVD
jgi:hypothetical protein